MFFLVSFDNFRQFKNVPFFQINCGGMSEGTIESELFGHIKGAFTGAVRDKPGLLEIANGGTMFLDELGEMPKPIQAKLLRVVPEGTAFGWDYTPTGVQRSFSPAATVLHALPDGRSGSRSPIQVGAELFGHDGVESDCEVLQLMLETLATAGVENLHLDIGHVGIYRVLAACANLGSEREAMLHEALQMRCDSRHRSWRLRLRA